MFEYFFHVSSHRSRFRSHRAHEFLSSSLFLLFGVRVAAAAIRLCREVRRFPFDFFECLFALFDHSLHASRHRVHHHLARPFLSTIIVIIRLQSSSSSKVFVCVDIIIIIIIESHHARFRDRLPRALQRGVAFGQEQRELSFTVFLFFFLFFFVFFVFFVFFFRFFLVVVVGTVVFHDDDDDDDHDHHDHVLCLFFFFFFVFVFFFVFFKTTPTL